VVTQYVIMVGLIDHVLEHCLIHFPYPYLLTLQQMCFPWRTFLWLQMDKDA